MATEPAQPLILSVDDDIYNQHFIEVLLEKQNYRVASVNDGHKALSEARRLNPDMVLLDINMPGMDGFEVCRHLKEDKLTAHIPIIFVTGASSDDVLDRAFQCGATDYVCKPINRRELAARINAALLQSRLTQKRLEKEKLDALLETAGAVCHEFNQPLQILSITCEIMAIQNNNGPEMDKRIQTIRKQVNRMAGITKKLTKIAKYRTRPYVGSDKIVDLEKSQDQ